MKVNYYHKRESVLRVHEKTLARSISYHGFGLHSGAEVNLTIHPAQAGTGIFFRRVDLPGQPEFKAAVSNVVSTVRCTALGLNEEVKVMTVEHLMAALHGLGVDNAVVELDNCEVPVTDGSAAVWVRLITEAGLVEQNRIREYLTLPGPVWVEERGAKLIALPAESFSVSYLFTSDHPAVGNQFAEYAVEPEVFAERIAPARTLGFAHEVEVLRKQGLALGGNPEIAVVIGTEGYLNEVRFPDEVVRHKVLDLIGDLALVGRLKAQVIGIRSGHHLNHLLGQQILATLGNSR